MIQYSQRDLKKSDLLYVFLEDSHKIKQWPYLELNEDASEKSKQAYKELLAMMLEDKDKEVNPFI